MIWFYVYLAGVALLLALFVQLRRWRLQEATEDEPIEPLPIWVVAVAFGVAVAWPLIAAFMFAAFVL